MSKKFIQNIQKLIEEKDPKKDLGLVSEGNISHFQAKPPALVIPPGEIIEPASDPTDPTSNRRKRNILRNLVWTYSHTQTFISIISSIKSYRFNRLCSY